MMINCSDKHKIKIGRVINARRGGAVERPQARVWVCVRVFVSLFSLNSLIVRCLILAWLISEHATMCCTSNEVAFVVVIWSDKGDKNRFQKS